MLQRLLTKNLTKPSYGLISKLRFNLNHRYSTSGSSHPRICIVGAGPAGFYAAQYILKTLQDCKVDVIEKLPVPFGLVRFGVAPDHPDVKNVINSFTKTAENSRFNFYGNVTLGKDVTLQQLRDNYHAVLLTYGADQDRKLGIENEIECSNVLSARNFVAWYNGLPGAENLNPNLSGKCVTIVGQGNVAVDVARMLLSPIDDLKKTDTTSYALETLASSKVEQVYLVGRRGPLQVAFTIKELREMLKLPNVSTQWRPQDFEGIAEVVDKLARPRKRLTELMLQSLKEQSAIPQNKKQFLPIFMRSPKLLKDNKLIFNVNKMQQDKAIATEQEETLPADLVLRSIGYKSSCADNAICFDVKVGRVLNEQGRVLKTSKDTSIDKGLYVAGWLGSGPTGVILTTMNGAFAVAKNICNDVLIKEIKTDDQKLGLQEILKTHAVVSWQGWQKIDQEETKRGLLVGKPREKIVNIEEMLKVAGV